MSNWENDRKFSEAFCGYEDYAWGLNDPTEIPSPWWQVFLFIGVAFECSLMWSLI